MRVCGLEPSEVRERSNVLGCVELGLDCPSCQGTYLDRYNMVSGDVLLWLGLAWQNSMDLMH